MISPPEIQMAATAAMEKLEESGRVPKISISKRETTTAVTFEYNEEVDAYVAAVEGTFGIKTTDLFVSFIFLYGGQPYDYLKDKDFQVTSPLYAGNLSIAGMGEDTGEGCLIIIDFEQNHSLIITPIPLSGEVEVIAFIAYETIHPIDDKFLPGVCLPLVELTTEPTAEGAVLTAEESARVDDAIRAHDHILLDFMSVGFPWCAPFRRVRVENGLAYFGTILSHTLILGEDMPGEWKFMVQGS